MMIQSISILSCDRIIGSTIKPTDFSNIKFNRSKKFYFN